MKNILLVDTQSIRAKLLAQLQGIFDMAVGIAKGKVKHFKDDEGKEHKVTLKQREKWARIAAYAAQVMSGLATGFDEKQFQTDLKKLEAMVAEVQRVQSGKKDPAVV
jgi:UDP-galactopyranose mutase